MGRRRYATLAEYFDKSGHSQKEIAEKLNLSPSYVSMLAAGLRTPSLSLGEQLKKLTGVPTEGMIANQPRQRPVPRRAEPVKTRRRAYGGQEANPE